MNTTTEIPFRSQENWSKRTMILKLRPVFGGLFVNLAPVRDPRHIDSSGRVVNLVHNTVIAGANPPFATAALEFLESRRPGTR